MTMRLIFIFMFFYGIVVYGKGRTFEDFLRKNELEENSIDILIRNGITSTKVLLVLDEDDITSLDLNRGQRALLRDLIKKLKASDGDEETPYGKQQKDQYSDWADEETEKRDKKYNQDKKPNLDEKLENMSETHFWCIFKCLGGIGAVGIGGILALVALVTYGLPVLGFGVAGIAAGSLAAKIMALYGGQVAAGGLVATLQSVAAAGMGWKAILTALFGSSAVMTAIQGACSHCFD